MQFEVLPTVVAALSHPRVPAAPVRPGQDPPHPARHLFRALMERIGNREPGLLLVAHEDRLCRFGIDWFAYFAEPHGCEIRVVNQPSLSPQASGSRT